MTYTGATQIISLTAGFVMKFIPLSKITKEVARLMEEQGGDDRSLIPAEDRQAMDGRIAAGMLEIAKRPASKPKAMKAHMRTKDHH